MLHLTVDFGNGFSLLSDGEQVVSLKSVYCEASQDIPNKDLTTTVRYKQQGKLYAVGEACVGLQNAIETLNTTKPEAAKFIFPGLVCAFSDLRPINDIYLTVIDSNPSINSTAYEKVLMGEHRYHFDLGDQSRTLLINILSVDVVREGLGTFNRYIQLNGMPITSGKNFVAIQNIGAGTMDLLVFDGLGNEVSSYTLQDMGCAKFAQFLSSKLRESGKVDGDMPISQIFTALESGKLTFWDRENKTTKDLDVSRIVAKVAKDYYFQAMKKMVGQLTEYRTQIAKVIFTGGLASHVTLTDKEKAFCAIADNPLLDNVLGV